VRVKGPPNDRFEPTRLRYTAGREASCASGSSARRERLIAPYLGRGFSDRFRNVPVEVL